MWIIFCEVEGCGRYANATFNEGTHMEKCPTCGDDHSVNDYHEFCYEHAYLYFKEKHAKYVEEEGYFNSNTLSNENLSSKQTINDQKHGGKEAK